MIDILKEYHRYYTEDASAAQKKSFEILELFSSGNYLIYRENTLGLQNTNRSNYPALLKEFIKDVNKSVDLLTKALVELYKAIGTENECFMFLGHEIDFIQNENKYNIVSNSTKENMKEYVRYIKKKAAILYDYLSLNTVYVNHDKVLDYLQKIIECKNEYGSSYYLLRHFASYIGKDLQEKMYATSHPEEIVDIMELFSMCNVEKNNIFHFVAFSANLYDEKIIPKKSFYNRIEVSEVDCDFDFELIVTDGCNLTKKGLKIYGSWKLEFGIEFYIKKYIIEKMMNSDFFFFMVVYKDFLAKNRDMLQLVEDPSAFNEDHQFIAAILQTIEMEKEIKYNVDIHQKVFRTVQKMVDYFQTNKLILKREVWQASLGDSVFLKIEEYGNRYKSYSATEIIQRSAQMFSQSAMQLIQNYYTADKKGVLREIFKQENYIHAAITGMLDVLYEKKSNTKEIESGEHVKNIYLREKATFHTVMSNSFVFDYRSSVSPIYSEAVNKKIEENNESFKELMEVLKSHPYHDFFEFDKDVFSKDSSMNIEQMLLFFKGTSKLNLPIKQKISFKARKLGNYLAIGIYFLHTKTLGVDYRKSKNGIKSYIHEVAHHIDLNDYFSGRDEIIEALYEYFQNRIKNRKDYYLSDEELIARGAEIGNILCYGNYFRHKKHFCEDTRAMLNAIKKDFQDSELSDFMFTMDEYEQAREYLDLSDMVLKGEFELLDMVYDFFQNFWDARRRENLAESLSSFNGSKKKIKSLMLKLYPDSHRSYDYVHYLKYGITTVGFNAEQLSMKYFEMIDRDISPYPVYTYEKKENYKKIIKKLWVFYEKYGNEALVENIKILKDKKLIVMNKQMEKEIEDEFEKRFRNDEEFLSKKKTLLFVLNKVYIAI